VATVGVNHPDLVDASPSRWTTMVRPYGEKSGSRSTKPGAEKVI